MAPPALLLQKTGPQRFIPPLCSMEEALDRAHITQPTKARLLSVFRWIALAVEGSHTPLLVSYRYLVKRMLELVGLEKYRPTFQCRIREQRYSEYWQAILSIVRTRYVPTILGTLRWKWTRADHHLCVRQDSHIAAIVMCLLCAQKQADCLWASMPSDLLYLIFEYCYAPDAEFVSAYRALEYFVQ